MNTIWKWLRFLNPANLLLIKKIVDAFEALIRLIEELFPNPDKKDKDK